MTSSSNAEDVGGGAGSQNIDAVDDELFLAELQSISLFVDESRDRETWVISWPHIGDRWDVYLPAYITAFRTINMKGIMFHDNGFGNRMNFHNSAGLWNRLHQLERLGLDQENIGVDCCFGLTKLLQNERSRLKTLSLNGNRIDGECLSILADALRFNEVLEVLELGRNSIGVNECAALSTLLQNSNSRIKRINLSGNNIGDECASILAESLKGNAMLRDLDLDGNDGITPIGWKHFLDLLCDVSSIEKTYRSNHTLCSLGYSFILDHQPTTNFASDCLPPVGSRSFVRGEEDIPGRLYEVLWDINSVDHTWAASIYLQNGFDGSDNSTAHEKGRNKVLWNHLSGKFNLDGILDLDVKIMPQLITFIGRNRGLYGLHQIVRDWNVPILFGFPSHHQERVCALEAENASLLKEVEKLRATVDKVKTEMKALEEENAMLRYSRV